MAIDSLTLVRRRLGDSKKDETESFTLGETGLSVQLQYEAPTIINVYDQHRAGSPLVLDTDYALNGNTLTLLYTPQEGAILTVVYTHTAFSDDELNSLINDYGVNGAILEGVRWLMADSAKLYSYSRGATRESLNQVFRQLKELLHEYERLGNQLDPNNKGETSTGVTISERSTQWYRGTTPRSQDLSRDDL